MFPFQVGVIQMAADKTMLKKKKTKGCTQELMFIANKNKNREREKRRWSEAQHIRLRI